MKIEIKNLKHLSSYFGLPISYDWLDFYQNWIHYDDKEVNNWHLLEFDKKCIKNVYFEFPDRESIALYNNIYKDRKSFIHIENESDFLFIPIKLNDDYKFYVYNYYEIDGYIYFDVVMHKSHKEKYMFSAPLHFMSNPLIDKIYKYLKDNTL